MGLFQHECWKTGKCFLHQHIGLEKVLKSPIFHIFIDVLIQIKHQGVWCRTQKQILLPAFLLGQLQSFYLKGQIRKKTSQQPDKCYVCCETTQTVSAQHCSHRRRDVPTAAESYHLTSFTSSFHALVIRSLGVAHKSYAHFPSWFLKIT